MNRISWWKGMDIFSLMFSLWSTKDQMRKIWQFSSSILARRGAICFLPRRVHAVKLPILCAQNISWEWGHTKHWILRNCPTQSCKYSGGQWENVGAYSRGCLETQGFHVLIEKTILKTSRLQMNCHKNTTLFCLQFSLISSALHFSCTWGTNSEEDSDQTWRNSWEISDFSSL